jgi:regulator of sigma E protease
LSGPISIAQYAGQTAQLGISEFILFLAIISVSLGVLNLLPIPLLDGGHLFYFLVEFITRRPVSKQFMIIGQQIGIFVLVMLMSVAVYNDIVRLSS